MKLFNQYQYNPFHKLKSHTEAAVKFEDLSNSQGVTEVLFNIL